MGDFPTVPDLCFRFLEPGVAESKTQAPTFSILSGCFAGTYSLSLSRGPPFCGEGATTGRSRSPVGRYGHVWMRRRAGRVKGAEAWAA